MVQPIVPDVLVRPGRDGGFRVELNSDTLPKVLINQGYHAEVGGPHAEVVALDYLLKAYGYHAAERLNVHLMEMMKRRSQARAWVREDTE